MLDPKYKLWTKDFTLITIGTIISMFGHAVATFTAGLIVYQVTDSTLLYSIYTAISLLPYIIVSFFAGPIADRFSRKKIIVFLDFLVGANYLLFALFYVAGWLDNYYVLLVLGLFIGSNNAIYQITYDSFYPTLVKKRNFSKAYSISSMIYPIASTIMVPISAWAYDAIGVEYLFIVSGIMFILTATSELFITTDKPANKIEGKKYKVSLFIDDLKKGAKYVKNEKGLLYIIIYFICTTLSNAIMMALLLPFFESHTVFDKQDYSFVMAFNTLGRVTGAVIHYFFKYKAKHNFNIAVSVYIITSVLLGTLLFTPLWMMFVLNFLVGLLSVTSFTIRTSATQNYVPNEMRGRFNSLFYMLTTGFASVLGQIIGGAFGEAFDIRWIIATSMIFNIICVFVFVVLKKKDISKVYNNEL